MNQNAHVHTHFGHPIPPSSYEDLLAYLRESGNALSPEAALACAIKHWIARSRADAAPTRGYQWKQLFLPEGTRLRMHVADSWHSAEIIGDDLIYRDRAVSPNQMVREAFGDVRNAWREIHVRFPGEKNWASAALLRARLSKQAAAKPLSPADAMVIAAKSMSDALSTALTLVEHANHQSQNTLERRLPRYRREHDLLEDID